MSNWQPKLLSSLTKGMKVYIIGDHPHKGEFGIVEAIETVKITGKQGAKIKGNNESFFVFDIKHIHLLP